MASQSEVLFKAACLPLADGTESGSSVSLDRFYQWTQRNLWTATLKLTGQGSFQSVFEFGDRVETTTFSCQASESLVRNDGRENLFPEIGGNGKVSLEPSKDFNPEGPYGKIPDSDLLRILHNPCFDCSFTAWFNCQTLWTNYLIVQEPGSPDPTKPNDWSDWSITGVDREIIRQPSPVEDPDEIDLFHIRGTQNFVLSSGLVVLGGKIKLADRNVYPEYVVSGSVQPSDSGQSEITVDGRKTGAQCLGVPDDGTAPIKVQLAWVIGKDRPL